MSSVAIQNLDIRYGSVHVVKSLDLEIRDGEFLVLLELDIVALFHAFDHI